MVEKAYQYFGDSAKLDLFNLHNNTKDGIHTANMGGNYMAVVYGFAGLRLKEKGLCLAPILPRQWKEYRFLIVYHSSKIQITINSTQVELALLDGKAIADEMGIFFDEKINNRLRGVSRKECFKIILEQYQGKLSEEEKEKYMQKKNDIYLDLLRDMTPDELSVEVKHTLEALQSKKIKLAIGSSSKNARIILRQLGIEDYFDVISDGNNIVHSKPDPEVFIMAAQYVHEKPADCLVVEDAKAGLEAAIKGGMDCAAIGDAVLCGIGTYNLSKFSELLEIIK